MDGRGKQSKGKNFERKVAKEFSLHYKTNVSRTAYSGATRGIETQYNHSDQTGNMGFVGDLFFPADHPMSIFNYELKNHDSVKFTQFFNSNGEIPSFMEQVTTDSSRLGGVGHTVPCLIIHIKRENDYALFPFKASVYQVLAKEHDNVLATMISYTQERTETINRYNMIVTTLDNFMSLDPDFMYQQYKNFNWDSLNTHEIKHKKVDLNKLIDEV